MLREAPQSISANVTFADVPVPIDARIVRRFGIVEVDRVHVPESNGLLDNRERRLQTLFFTNIVTGRERMRGVDANAQGQLLGSVHDGPQVFEAMTDAFALAGGVFKQNLQLAESQTLASNLKTERANFQGILFRTPTRAAGMHDQIINAERNRALNFFAERIDRFQQDDFIGSGKINQIICVNQDRRELRLFSRLPEECD